MGLRRQKIEKAAGVARRVPEKRPGRQLQTLAGITREMIRVYVQARNGEMEAQKAGTLCRILERIKFTVAQGPLEQRLSAIEAQLNERVRGGPGEPGNGNAPYQYDDDERYQEHDERERLQ